MTLCSWGIVGGDRPRAQSWPKDQAPDARMTVLAPPLPAVTESRATALLQEFTRISEARNAWTFTTLPRNLVLLADKLGSS
jgi:hypothetical protein